MLAERAVQSALVQQFRRGPLFDQPALIENQEAVGALERGEAMRDTIVVRRRAQRRMAWQIARSDSALTLAVASSRIRIAGSNNKARAIESRCRSPPESPEPPSPSCVS